jgi:hypothetical protein
MFRRNLKLQPSLSERLKDPYVLDRLEHMPSFKDLQVIFQQNHGNLERLPVMFSGLDLAL